MVDIKKFHKKDIATQQLKTAIDLLLSNNDLSSVITLAGAASNILSQLVRNEGKEPFIDFACKVHNFYKGNTPPRKKYSHYTDKILGIIMHKHMSNTDNEFVILDLERCAVDAVIKAIMDYTTLFGQEDYFIKNFLAWSWKNEDSSKILTEYNKLSKELKGIK